MAGRWCAPASRRGIPPRSTESTFTFIAPWGFGRPLTRGPVRLLGPCFKTGRAGARLRSATRGATCRLAAPAACRPSATAGNSGRRGGLRGTGGAAPRGGGAGAARDPFLGSSVDVAAGAISSPQRHGGQGGATCAGAFGRPGLPVPSAASGRSARAHRRHPPRPGPLGSGTATGRRPAR